MAVTFLAEPLVYVVGGAQYLNTVETANLFGRQFTFTGGADLAFGRALLGLLGKRARIANAPYAQQIEHAAVDGLGEIEEGGARPWNGVREYAFRTAVGSARDNRCAGDEIGVRHLCLLYTSPSPRD